MKKFEPSADFVSRVMGEVSAYEAQKKKNGFRFQKLPVKPVVTYALSGGGIILGLINFLRIYLAVFSPVACK